MCFTSFSLLRFVRRMMITPVVLFLLLCTWANVWGLDLDNPPTIKKDIRLNSTSAHTITSALRPFISAIHPSTCIKPGDEIEIIGRNFGQHDGKIVVLNLVGISGGVVIELRVTAWSDSRIDVIVPIDSRIGAGRRYIVGVENSDHSGWLSNTEQAIMICRESSEGAGPVTTPPEDSSVNSGSNEVEMGTEEYQGQGLPDTGAIPIVGGSLIGQEPSAESEEKSIERDPPDVEPGEIVALSKDMAEAQALAQQLAGEGIRVIRRRKMTRLGLVISVFRLPQDGTVIRAVKGINKAFPDITLDANHLYHLQGRTSEKPYANDMIGWQGDNSCGVDLRIGMVDTGIDLHHPALNTKEIYSKSFVSVGYDAADTGHGTAIAALLVGTGDENIRGLVPSAKLFVAEIFRRTGKRESDTTAEWIVSALDWLIGRHVMVINMSLGGPHNRLVELAVNRVMEDGIPVIAAAGNDGARAPAVYPAAQRGVIAVTAVDADTRPYQNANQGTYIRYAAPGVDVLSAANNGQVRYFSGTSFATPFVTATYSVYRLRNSAMTQADILNDLDSSAKDLGQPGRDPVYGVGLIQSIGRCYAGR